MGIKKGVSVEKGELTAVFATNLNKVMDELEMTYRDLSKASGLSLKAVYNYCSGENSPTLTSMELMSKSMRVSVNALLTPDASIDTLLSRRPDRAMAALSKLSAEQLRDAVNYLEEMAGN
jgi:transcriptional regulator with XRE-family HTH domain